jgi:sortase A
MHYHLVDDSIQLKRFPKEKLLGFICLAVFLLVAGKVWVPYLGAVVNASAITFLPPDLAQSYFAATLPKTAQAAGQNKLSIHTKDLRIEAPIVEGDSFDDLLKGVGHDPQSAKPGEQGRVVISGHRFYPNSSPYATVFFALDKLKVGDVINLTYDGQNYKYTVKESWETSKDKAVEHLGPSTGRELTIYTCNPTYSSQRRLGFTAVMDESAIKSESQKVIDTLHEGLLQ